jgi:hypothetical protein
VEDYHMQACKLRPNHRGQVLPKPDPMPLPVEEVLAETPPPPRSGVGKRNFSFATASGSRWYSWELSLAYLHIGRVQRKSCRGRLCRTSW